MSQNETNLQAQGPKLPGNYFPPMSHPYIADSKTLRM
jgi:hypothetical protein